MCDQCHHCLLQPPSSILKAEFMGDTSTTSSSSKVTAQRSLDTKRSLQRTSRVDMNDPEQPLLLNEMHSTSSSAVLGAGTGTSKQIGASGSKTR